MGSGKTSALDAICFALFGTFPALKSRRVRLEEVVMARPEKQERASVEMVFDAGGKTYSVSRAVSARGGSEAVLKCDGKAVEVQSERVTEAIERLLGINYELFTRAIYSEQNKIDYFIALGKGERKKQVDELLGIDRFEAARANAVTALNKLREARENAVSFLQGIDYENAEKEAARAAEEVREIRSTVVRNEERLAALLKERQEKENAAKKVEEEEKRFRAAEKKLEGLKYALAEMEREAVERKRALKFFVEKNRIVSVEEAARKEISLLRQAEREIRELKFRQERAGAELSLIEGDKKKLGGVKKALVEERLRALEELAAQKKTELKKIQDETNERVAMARECENSLAVLAKESAACPVCNSPLPRDRHAELRRQKQALLDRLGSEISELRGRSAVVEEEIERISSETEKQRVVLTQLNRIESLGEQEKKARSELAETTRRIEELEKHFSEEKMRSAEEKLKEIEKCKQLLEAEEKITQLKNEVAKAEKEFKEIVFDENMQKEVVREIVEIEKEVSRLSAESEALKALAGEKEKALGEWRRKSKTVEEKREEITRLDEKIRRMTVFQNALVDAQAVLRSELIDAVNGAMAALWPNLYPYNDYKGVRLRADYDGYALELQALDGFWTGIENASGGERSCASLVLRVAFAMVLAPNLSWLVLDEPTHNLDREAVIMLCNALREEIPKIVEQTFIITHDEALREGASARIYRVERDKDRGEKSVVEEVS